MHQQDINNNQFTAETFYVNHAVSIVITVDTEM